MARFLSALIAAVAMGTIGFTAQQPPAANVPRFTYQIVRTYPHDPQAFTQGLQFVDGALYEGTGLNGRSSIRIVKLDTGEVLQKRDVPTEHFGEGITVFKNEIFELTWQTKVCFVYDKNSFAPKKRFPYTGEGWGLTNDGTSLIMSDGTDALRFIEPSTFVEKKRIVVRAGAAPVDRLNELEWVKGEIFANIWQTDTIARIDPASGRVTGYIDLGGLLTRLERARTDVLNGIAYDAEKDRLFVTGKLWPKLFEIKVVPKDR
jgi:glutaminyl-peptide cyclotransferase